MAAKPKAYETMVRYLQENENCVPWGTFSNEFRKISRKLLAGLFNFNKDEKKWGGLLLLMNLMVVLLPLQRNSLALLIIRTKDHNNANTEETMTRAFEPAPHGQISNHLHLFSPTATGRRARRQTTTEPRCLDTTRRQ